MLYDDKCFNCSKRKEYVDTEIEEAKKFYLDYGCSWKFRCGASYSKEYMNRFGVEIISISDCMAQQVIT